MLILNTAPTALTGVAIDFAPRAKSDDDLTATGSGATDIDGDPLGTRGFIADGVHPNRGSPMQTRFMFACRVTDPDGQPPTLSLLVERLQDGGQWAPLRRRNLNPGAGDWASGVMCAFTMPLPNGVLRYSCSVVDDEGAAAGGLNGCLFPGPKMDAPPQLRCTALPGRASDYVDPDTGTAWDTNFSFAVQYTDGEGESPYVRRIHIQRKRDDGSWGAFTSAVTRAWGGTPRGGGYYVHQTKLPPGEYRFRFLFLDHAGTATGADSGSPDAGPWQYGPIVSRPAAPADAVAAATPVTSLRAVPTATGARITFSLSSPAQVQARIPNIAGRPVRTLCGAKDCEAGTNMLLWNAQSDQGLAVPNGIYLVEVTARARGGSEARALGQVRVGR